MEMEGVGMGEACALALQEMSNCKTPIGLNEEGETEFCKQPQDPQCTFKACTYEHCPAVQHKTGICPAHTQV